MRELHLEARARLGSRAGAQIMRANIGHSGGWPANCLRELARKSRRNLTIIRCVVWPPSRRFATRPSHSPTRKVSGKDETARHQIAALMWAAYSRPSDGLLCCAPPAAMVKPEAPVIPIDRCSWRATNCLNLRRRQVTYVRTHAIEQSERQERDNWRGSNFVPRFAAREDTLFAPFA